MKKHLPNILLSGFLGAHVLCLRNTHPFMKQDTVAYMYHLFPDTLSNASLNDIFVNIREHASLN